MSWFVRERFESGLPIPADVAAPANGSPLFRAIVRRQILSLDWMRVRCASGALAAMDPAALARRTLEVEWPRIRAEIDAGRLAMVGLIRHHGWNPMLLDRDHQVLAFAYETDGPGGAIDAPPIRPELAGPRRCDAPSLDRGFRQSTGEPLLGVLSMR